MGILISKSGRASNPFLDKVKIVQGDIAQQDVDAIAIVIPQNMEFRGSLNGSVQAACGRNLDEFILENIYKPRAGDVYAIPAFGLPARHILVGVLPYFRTDFDRTEGHLSGISRKIMELARCMLLRRVAVPPLAMGKNGYPKAKGARLILQGVTDRLEENFEDVRIVCSDAETVEIFKRKMLALVQSS